MPRRHQMKTDPRQTTTTIANVFGDFQERSRRGSDGRCMVIACSGIITACWWRCRLPRNEEAPNGPRGSLVGPRALRPDSAPRRVVGKPARDHAGALGVRRVRDLGRLPGTALLLGSVPLAFLFS